MDVESLERVDLSSMNFVQLQGLLIAAQDCRPSGLGFVS